MSSATHKAVYSAVPRRRFQGGLGSIWYPALNVHRKVYGKNPGLAVCLNHKMALSAGNGIFAGLFQDTRMQNKFFGSFLIQE